MGTTRTICHPSFISHSNRYQLWTLGRASGPGCPFPWPAPWSPPSSCGDAAPSNTLHTSPRTALMEEQHHGLASHGGGWRLAAPPGAPPASFLLTGLTSLGWWFTSPVKCLIHALFWYFSLENSPKGKIKKTTTNSNNKDRLPKTFWANYIEKWYNWLLKW